MHTKCILNAYKMQYRIQIRVTIICQAWRHSRVSPQIWIQHLLLPPDWPCTILYCVHVPQVPVLMVVIAMLVLVAIVVLSIAQRPFTNGLGMGLCVCAVPLYYVIAAWRQHRPGTGKKGNHVYLKCLKWELLFVHNLYCVNDCYCVND